MDSVTKELIEALDKLAPNKMVSLSREAGDLLIKLVQEVLEEEAENK